MDKLNFSSSSNGSFHSAKSVMDNYDAVYEAGRLTRESKQAAIEASKELVQIRSEMASFRVSLDKEKSERIALDKDNREYTRKMDRRNFVISLVAAISGIVGTIIAIAALIVSLVK